MYISRATGSTASATVSGSGSLLDGGNFLGIGVATDQVSNSGFGTLTLQSGGTASASTIRIGSLGSVTGAGNLIGNLTDAGGTIAPGFGGNAFGQISVNGNLSLPSGRINFDVGGIGSQSHDALQVSGGVNLSGGNLNISFSNGYQPHAGDQIQLITAGGGFTGFFNPAIVFSQPESLPYIYNNGKITFTGGIVSPSPIPIFDSTRFVSFPAFGQIGRNSVKFDGTNFVISATIGLTGDPAATEVRQAWESGIEGIWSRNFNFIDGSGTYPIVIDVTFVDFDARNAQNYDYVVRVHNQYCQSFTNAISDWCSLPMTDTSGEPHLELRGQVAAHEFGHMLGLYDEYSPGGGTDANVNSNDLCRNLTIFGLGYAKTGTFCNSLMADFGPVQERYFEGLLSFIESTTGHTFVIGANPILSTYPFADPGVDFLNMSDFFISNEIDNVTEPSFVFIFSMAGALLLTVRFRTRCMVPG